MDTFKKILSAASIFAIILFPSISSAEWWAKGANSQLYTNGGNGLGNSVINVAGCNGCGGGSGGGTIGSAVTGGTPNSVLFVNPSGNLGQDNPAFTYTNTYGLHVGGTAGASNALVGGYGGEFVGSNNNSGGVNLIVGNTSNGTSAFSDLFLQNDLSNSSLTHFATVNLNSSGYNSTAFGTIFAIPNQLQVYGTDGPTTIGTTAANSYVNFFLGGSATTNEIGRLNNSGLVLTRQTGTLPIATTYKSVGYNVSSYVGIIGNPELNSSFNMDYSKNPGIHEYSNSAYPAIWTAQSSSGYGIQVAPAGITQTGIGTFTLTGGSGYTNNTYTNVTLTGGTGSGTATIVVSGGTVTSVTVNLLSTGYTVGDNVGASGIGPGSGFNMHVTAVYNDIWTSSGSKYLMITDLNSHVGFGFANGSPFGNARVESNAASGTASYSGITNLVLEGNQTAGVSGNVLINSLSNSLFSVNAGGGHAIFGASSTPQGVLDLTGSYTSSAGTARGFYNHTTLTPTADGDTLVAQDNLNTFAVGTGALTATISTSSTSASDGTYDNSAATNITGTGSGQTWQVTVSGGVVTAIQPGSTATGGIGYAIGDQFSVAAAPGAVFTVATLGYTGVQTFSARMNNPLLFLTSSPPNRTNGMIWYQSPSLFGYFNNTLVNFTAPTTVGTVTAGTWNATAIAVLHGGTGATTANAGFNALSPMTTGGDLIYGGASGAGTRLANGTAGQILTSAGGTSAPTWSSTVTSTSFNSTAAQTTVSCSTSGSVVFSEPLQGTSSKQVIAYENSCLGTASYTYPTAFTNTPDSLGVNVAKFTSISTSAVTVTGTTTSGFSQLYGY